MGNIASLQPLHAEPLSLVLSVQRSESARDCAEREALLEKLRQLASATNTIAKRATNEASAPIEVTEPSFVSSESEPRSSSALRVAVSFDRRGTDYSAGVRFFGAKSGFRHLRDRGADCSSLEDAVAVSIILLLDSERQAEESLPRFVPRVVSSIELSRGKMLLLPVPQRRQWTLAATAGLLWGASKTASFWIKPQLGLRHAERWDLELGLLALLPNTQSYERGAVTVSMIGAELRGCGSWGGSAWVGICVGPILGRLRGSGRGFDENISPSLLWAALAASAQLEVPLGRTWFVALEGGAWWPFLDQSFSVENAGVAWNSAPIWGVLASRLGVRLR